jgi:hypothetical protein
MRYQQAMAQFQFLTQRTAQTNAAVAAAAAAAATSSNSSIIATANHPSPMAFDPSSMPSDSKRRRMMHNASKGDASAFSY